MTFESEGSDILFCIHHVIQTKHRCDLFNKAFKHMQERIDPIYKDLTKGKAAPMGGVAYLSAEEYEVSGMMPFMYFWISNARVQEPYVGGIKYHAMPPMKRFRDMEQLSGGEKTVAALALLFAIHRFVRKTLSCELVLNFVRLVINQLHSLSSTRLTPLWTIRTSPRLPITSGIRLLIHSNLSSSVWRVLCMRGAIHLSVFIETKTRIAPVLWH